MNYGVVGLLLLSFFCTDACQFKPYNQFVLFGSKKHVLLQQRLVDELNQLPFVLESYQKKGRALDIEVAQCGPLTVANHCDNGYEFIHVYVPWAYIQDDKYKKLKSIMHLVSETQLVSPTGPLKYRLDEYISQDPCKENEPCSRCIDAAHILRCSMVYPHCGNSFLKRRLLREVMLTTKNRKMS